MNPVELSRQIHTKSAIDRSEQEVLGESGEGETADGLPRIERLDTRHIDVPQPTTAYQYSRKAGLEQSNSNPIFVTSSRQLKFKLCHSSSLPFTDQHVSAPGARRGKGTDIGTPDYYSDYKNQV